MRATPSLVVKIAAEAARDPATVRRVLAGKGSSTSRQAIDDALKRLNIDPATLNASAFRRLPRPAQE